MGQTTIFEMLYPTFKIDKEIKLITLFSGYDSQALSLRYLGVPFIHHKTCEWAVKSIQALKNLHFAEDNTDYSKDLNKAQLQEYLFSKGISQNYNVPMTREQINRLKEDNLRTIYNNIQATHNLVNIQQVKGKDLEIEDTDKYCYIMTYSFPCQDLSLAGKGKGMSDTSTRSGMLWEVERILTECKELGRLPQVLVMENVPLIHSVENTPDFNKWQLRLEELGYKNYWQDMIATNYGIPQTRNRTFMVSILGDYNYTFPKPIPLTLKLKDMLEDNVDEKYYLSDDLMQHIQKTAEEHEEYTQYDRYNGDLEMWCRVWKDKSPTLNTKCKDTKIYVKNNTKKGYLEATDDDGIDLNMPRYDNRRGRVQKEAIQTLTTQNNLGVCVGTYQFAKSDNFMQGKDRLQLGKEVFDTIQTTQKEGIVNSDLRIRKLTPKECFRLMGVKDEDFEKVKKNQSDSSLYHLAGDSIVVNVLMAIFKEMSK